MWPVEDLCVHKHGNVHLCVTRVRFALLCVSIERALIVKDVAG